MRKVTKAARRLGTSTPTSDLPAIGASIRICPVGAARARAKSVARAVILDNFVRPYADRYSSLADHGDPEKLEIAIQIVRYRKGSYPVDCPTLTIGGYSQIWNMLRHEIEEFLDNQSYGKLICEVRHDIMFGGPLLYLENEEGDIELFTVAIPDRFEESN